MMVTQDLTMGGAIELSDVEFRQISDLVYANFGINLTEKKKALVKGRLSSLMRLRGFSSFAEYVKAVLGDRTGAELLNLVDRISTNHSFFFREPEHFDFLCAEVLPEVLKQRGTNHLRIWSAGCAAGEEPYTLAMILAQKAGIRPRPPVTPVLATDISTTALEKAAAGIYPPERLKNVPPAYRHYFRETGDGQYEVLEEIKRIVCFERKNFMALEFPFREMFDAIFCRNVMIYFDGTTRKKLVRKFAEYLRSGGYLFIGHSESLGRDLQDFQYIRPTVYRK